MHCVVGVMHPWQLSMLCSCCVHDSAAADHVELVLKLLHGSGAEQDLYLQWPVTLRGQERQYQQSLQPEFCLLLKKSLPNVFPLCLVRE